MLASPPQAAPPLEAHQWLLLAEKAKDNLDLWPHMYHIFQECTTTNRNMK